MFYRIKRLIAWPYNVIYARLFPVAYARRIGVNIEIMAIDFGYPEGVAMKKVNLVENISGRSRKINHTSFLLRIIGVYRFISICSHSRTSMKYV
jgi:hypothetical protein